MKPSQKAINSACRMLGIREHSEKQIRIKLIKKGFDRNEITEAVEFLYESSWLSNERFCGSFIRSKAGKGQGKIRIEFELQQNEISQILIDNAFEQENINWQAECERVLVKKVLSCCSNNDFYDVTFIDNELKVTNRKLEFKNKLKIERFMKYRGFEPGQVKKAFLKMNIQIIYQ